jgi:hypothetical protein
MIAGLFVTDDHESSRCRIVANRGKKRMALFWGKNKSLQESGTGKDGVADLDISAAILAHVQWKQRLLSYIDGKGEERLDPEVVGSDCLCTLGKWIHGYGSECYGEHPKFLSLKTIHADFHSCAAGVVHAVHHGEKEHALRLLQSGEYPKISNRIKSMLAGIALEFDFS